MAVIKVTTDAADSVTAVGLASDDDIIEYEEADSPFQGANNRNIDPGGLNLTFRGETGNPSDIVLDGQNNTDRGFNCTTAEVITLKAFTIANFKPTYTTTNGYGGGFHFNGAGVDATLEDMIIYECDNTYAGGGGLIGNTAVSAILTNVLVYDCEAGGYTFSRGGGLSFWNATGTQRFMLAVRF